MTARITKYLHNKWHIILILCIVSAIFFALRLFNLRSVPLFNDELINVRRAQLGAYDSSERFFSLKDGKQPLFIWMISFVTLKIGNPVVAAKAVSIMGGYLTMLSLFFLTQELFRNNRVAVLSALIYTVTPFALLTNRLILYENYVGLFAVLSTYLAIRIVKHASLGKMFLLAHVLGAGLLTKSSGLFNVYLLPLALVIADKKKKIIPAVIWGMLAVTVAFIYYSVIFLSPYPTTIGSKNEVFIYSLKELIPNSAFSKWPGQFLLFMSWIGIYFAILPLTSILFAFRQRKFWKEILVLFLWSFMQLLVFSLFARLAYPRHLYSMTLTLIPLIALGLFEIKSFFSRTGIILIIFSAIFISMLISDVKLLVDFPHAYIPGIALFQYSNGWPAGSGVKEIITYLSNEADKHKILVITEGGFSYGAVAATSIDIYLGNNPNVEKIEINEDPFIISSKLLNRANYQPVFVVLNRVQYDTHISMDLIAQYQKGIGESYMRLYKIRPE